MTDDTLSDVIKTSVNEPHTAKVLSFKGVTPEVIEPTKPSDQKTTKPANPDVVRVLETMLKAAVAGRVAFVAIASVSDEGVAHSTWEPETDGTPQLVTNALGAVSYLSHRFASSAIEGAEVCTPDDLA